MRALLLALSLFVLAVVGSGEGAAAERRHPVEAVTITYNQDGIRKGVVKASHDDFARLRYEESILSIGMAGLNIETKEWIIYQRGFIYRGDPEKKIINRTKNPFLEDIEDLEAALKDKEPKDIALLYLGAADAEETGETGKFAGESCDYYDSDEAGMRFCMTEDLLVLYMKAGFGPTAVERRAISIERGNPGPADAYTMPKEGYALEDSTSVKSFFKDVLKSD